LLALKIIKGGIAYSLALMPWMTVVHSWLPGWTAFGFPCLSEAVTTALVDIWPIMKPVSSKLYVSLSWMLYFALMFAARLN
jgi:hypothetical protein